MRISGSHVFVTLGIAGVLAFMLTFVGPIAVELAAMLRQRPMTEPGLSQSRAYVDDVLVPAVVAYRARHGQLPAELKDLKPEFLARIEPSRAGLPEWDYRVIPGTSSFVIKFGEDGFYPCEYVTVVVANDGTIASAVWNVDY